MIAVIIYCYLIKYQAKKKKIYLERFYVNKCIIKVSNKVKDIDIKNQAYYFSHDVINIKHFDANNVKTDERLYENILIIYYIGYVMTKASK